METSQTFSSLPWALGGNGTVNLLRDYLGAGREPGGKVGLPPQAVSVMTSLGSSPDS